MRQRGAFAHDRKRGLVAAPAQWHGWQRHRSTRPSRASLMRAALLPAAIAGHFSPEASGSRGRG
jgi:hypothetical protein